MQLIGSLDDPRLFEKKERVAVFKPHELDLPAHSHPGTGQKVAARKIKVTEADLPEIAANINKSYADDGQLVKLVIGHRSQNPNLPEHQQAKVAGYARHYRAELVQRPGGKALRLTHTEYIHKNKPYSKDVLDGQYPERSPEYDPVNKTITAVALLTRDQALPLGTVCYEAGTVSYAMGAEMNENNDVNNTGEADQWTPEDDAQYAKFCKYQKKYSASMGPLNGMLPGGDNKAPVNYSAAGDKVNYEASPTYAKHIARIAELEAQNVQYSRATLQAQCEAALQPLVEEIRFDYSRELGHLMSLPTTEARAEHLQYMQAHYGPVGGNQIRLADTVNYAKPPSNIPAVFQQTDKVKRAREIQASDSTGKMTWEECMRAAG